jgi:hypothetical protein
MIFREKLSVPILTIDGDQPAPLDGRTRIRICAFIEMLRKKQHDLKRDAQDKAVSLPVNRGKD